MCMPGKFGTATGVALAFGLLVGAAACGGGDGGRPTGRVGELLPGDRPSQIARSYPLAVFFVSGDNPGLPADDDDPYLGDGTSIGPYLEDEFVRAGWRLATFHYTGRGEDAPGPNGETYLGFSSLKDDLALAAQDPETQIVVIGHSHGGAWAHAALHELNGELGEHRVSHLVDLDVNQVGISLPPWTASTLQLPGLVLEIQDFVPSCVGQNLEYVAESVTRTDFVENMRVPRPARNRRFRTLQLLDAKPVSLRGPRTRIRGPIPVV